MVWGDWPVVSAAVWPWNSWPGRCCGLLGSLANPVEMVISPSWSRTGKLRKGSPGWTRLCFCLRKYGTLTCIMHVYLFRIIYIYIMLVFLGYPVPIDSCGIHSFRWLEISGPTISTITATCSLSCCLCCHSLPTSWWFLPVSCSP